MIEVDFDSVAETVVKECMRVKPGETILVSGGLISLELIEDIAVSIAKQRAHYLIVPYTDRLQKRLLLEQLLSTRYGHAALLLEVRPAPLHGVLVQQVCVLLAA